MSAVKIRALNDAFRTTMTGRRVMMTAGVDALPSDVKAMVIRRVATFSEFNTDNIKIISTYERKNALFVAGISLDQFIHAAERGSPISGVFVIEEKSQSIGF